MEYGYYTKSDYEVMCEIEEREADERFLTEAYIAEWTIDERTMERRARALAEELGSPEDEMEYARRVA